MADDFVKKNKRALIGLALLGILLGANILVRRGRTPPAAPGPITTPLPAPPAPGIPGPQPPPVPAPGVPGPQPALVPGQGAPAIPQRMETAHGRGAWAQILSRMKEMEELFEAIPEVLPDSRLAAPFATPSRDLFVWAVEGPVETVGTAPPVLASAPPPLMASAPAPLILGRFVKGGRTHLLVKAAGRVYLVTEGDDLPDAPFALESLASEGATLRDRTGKVIDAFTADPDQDGVQKALEILRGKARQTEYQVVASGSQKVQN